MDNRFYVYGHFEGKKCWYVGQGCGWRAWAFNQRNKLWNRVFNDQNRPQVKIFADNLTQEEAVNLEVEMIASYRLKGQCLLNFSSGGERGIASVKGRKLSDAHRAAISAAKKGRPNGLKGHEMPLQHRRKISEARKASDAVKASGVDIWATRRARGTDRGFTTTKAKAVICVETGVSYRCAKDAAISVAGSDKNIQACCTGKKKTHKGLTWRYVDGA